MELVNVHIETENVTELAEFYSRLIDVPVTLNEYYVEVPAGPGTVALSRPRVAGAPDVGPHDPCGAVVVLEFIADDVDGEFDRISALGVEWVLPPTTQPWGNRLMMFRDPSGNLVAVFSTGAR